jgi:DNA-binding cell septation regulator SpoVG
LALFWKLLMNVNEHDGIDEWHLSESELQRIMRMNEQNRLCFAAMFKFFMVEGRFPNDSSELPAGVLLNLARQLNASPKGLTAYDWHGRSAKRHKAEIRSLLKLKKVSSNDKKEFAAWLSEAVLSQEHRPKHLHAISKDWFQKRGIELPTEGEFNRLLGAIVQKHETAFYDNIISQLDEHGKIQLDALLIESDKDEEIKLADLKSDSGRIGLDSILRESKKLKCINEISFPSLFNSIPQKIMYSYYQRVMVESTHDMRRHQPALRYTLTALFCFRRRQEIIDGLVDLLSQIIHRISARADRRVERALLNDLRTVKGKHGLLYKIAQASVEKPEGLVRDVIYPVVSEQTLHDLMREFKAQGQAYHREVHNVIRASYGGHYRRMLPHLLDALEFCSNNELHQPVVEAIKFLKDTSTSKKRYLLIDDDVKRVNQWKLAYLPI